MSPSEIRECLLRHIPKRRNVLIYGIPGAGKSEIISSVAAELKYRTIWFHAVTADPIDVKGFPTTFLDKDGGRRASFIPFDELRGILDAQEPTVCVLDDLGQGAEMVKNSFMQMLQARRLNGAEVSPHVTFVAATNCVGHRAGVSPFPEPIKSRFPVKVELVPHVGDWCDWAEKQEDIAESIVQFARFTDSEFSQTTALFTFNPTPKMEDSCLPRTLANLGRMVHENPDIPYEEIVGCIGPSKGSEFAGFLKIWKDLPNLDDILQNPKKIKISEEPSTQFAVLSYVAQRVDSANFGKLMDFVRRYPKEYQFYFMSNVGKRNYLLTKLKEFTAWVEETGNRQLLTVSA